MGKEKAGMTPVGNAVAGALAGMYAVIMSYPFDLIKTRLHFDVGEAKAAGREARGIVKITKAIWTEGKTAGGNFRGFISFYRGLDQLLPEAAFKTMLRFFVFKGLQEKYKGVRGVDRVDFIGNIMCGATAGAIETTLVVQPFERGKTLRADFANPYKVWGNAFKTSGFAAGMRSIYTGYVPCLGRQVGNQATAFTFFYGIKDWHLARTGAEDLNTIQRVGYGFLAGASACCVTMPLDVAKSIAQKQKEGVTRGTVEILKTIVKDQGVLGLYAGLAPRVGRVGMDRAFGFLAFEFICEKILKYKRNQKASGQPTKYV